MDEMENYKLHLFLWYLVYILNFTYSRECEDPGTGDTSHSMQ